jgi:hypothetical protein
MSKSYFEILSEHKKSVLTIFNTNHGSKKIETFVSAMKESTDHETFLHNWLLFGNDISSQFLDSVRAHLKPVHIDRMEKAFKRLLAKGKIQRQEYDTATLCDMYLETKNPKWLANFEYVIPEFDAGYRYHGFVPSYMRPNSYIYN